MNEIAHLDWAYVKAQSQTRLESLRMQNDNATLDAVATAALRGEIRALKWLLDLPTAAALKSQHTSPAPGDERF